MDLPNEFPYCAITSPGIDVKNNTISFIVGTLVRDMRMEEIDDRALKYILYFEPVIGKVSLDFNVEDFRGTSMIHLGDYFRDLFRNHGITEFEFESSIVRQDRDPKAPGGVGLSIMGWEQPYLDSKLLPTLVLERLLGALGDKYKVTQLGIKYCAQLNHPIEQ
jgi:hypothetical protein